MPNFSVLVGLHSISRIWHSFLLFPFFYYFAIFRYHSDMPRRKKIENSVSDSKADDSFQIELGTAGRIVIPKAIREEMKWNKGDVVRIRTRRGRVIVSTPDGDAAFAKGELRKLSDDGD